MKLINFCQLSHFLPSYIQARGKSLGLLSSLGDLQPKDAPEQFVTVPCESRIKKIYFSLPKMSIGENQRQHKMQFGRLIDKCLSKRAETCVARVRDKCDLQPKGALEQFVTVPCESRFHIYIWH